MTMEEAQTQETVKYDSRIRKANLSTGDDKEDLRYGFGCFRPIWLQMFNNPKIVLVILSYAAFVQGFIVNGVINANMSTLEKRFEFRSSMSGWIASVYDVSAAPIALFVCFKGAKDYKLRWLGYGFISFSMGSFIMALPHVFADSYTWGIHTHALCLQTPQGLPCDDVKNHHLHEYIGVFLLGQIFHSVGGSILYSLGITILDDIVKPFKTPFYIGIMMFFASLGPALGYIIGGQFLNIFVDPSKGNKISFDSSDPRWVGAWWICFFISGALSICIGPILIGYGRELPVTKRIKLSRESQVHNGEDRNITDDLRQKDILPIVWSLIKNPGFSFVSLSSASEGIILAGLSTYFPKFFENQFEETATRSAFISGAIAIPAAAGGQFLGGYICKKFRLKVLGMGTLSIISLGLGLFPFVTFYSRCEEIAFAGVTHRYRDQPYFLSLTSDVSNSELSSKCNSHCNCKSGHYQPVCGSDNVQYFSACYAGCSTYNREQKTHRNCSCITGQLLDTAVDGKCTPPKCTHYYTTIGCLFLFTLLSFIAQTPMVTVVLRCIPDNHRSYGLGVSSVIGRLAGTFPGPILFGVAIDRACKAWKQSCLETDSFCWIYQKETLSRNFFLLTVTIRLFSILFLVTAKCLYKPPNPAVRTNINRRPRVNAFIVDRGFDNEAFSTNL